MRWVEMIKWSILIFVLGLAPFIIIRAIRPDSGEDWFLVTFLVVLGIGSAVIRLRGIRPPR